MLREEAWQDLVEQASDGAFVMDPAGRWADVNEACCRLLGWLREDLIGRPVAERLPSRDLPRWAAARHALLGGGALKSVEWTFVRKDGALVEVELTAKVFADGLCRGFLKDVTERKKVQAFKDGVIAMTSHELSSPLTTVRMALAFISEARSPADYQRLLAIARAAIERMIGLTRDSLDLEKIESGAISFRSERLELASLLEEAVSAMGAAAGDPRRIVLSPLPGDLELQSDGERLHQVVANLVSNALKFSPAGAPVEVSAERRGPSIRVSVRDRGPGIGEEFQRRIFGRYARAGGQKELGSGLGLCICKAIVERLGGRIGFQTAAGEGTTFYFELPAARSAAAA